MKWKDPQQGKTADESIHLYTHHPLNKKNCTKENQQIISISNQPKPIISYDLISEFIFKQLTLEHSTHYSTSLINKSYTYGIPLIYLAPSSSSPSSLP